MKKEGNCFKKRLKKEFEEEGKKLLEVRETEGNIKVGVKGASKGKSKNLGKSGKEKVADKGGKSLKGVRKRTGGKRASYWRECHRDSGLKEDKKKKDWGGGGRKRRRGSLEEILQKEKLKKRIQRLTGGKQRRGYTVVTTWSSPGEN